MMGLEIEPNFRRPTEVALQAQGGIDGDRAGAFHDLVDASRWHADVLGDPVFGEAEGNQEVFAENFSGVGGWKCLRGCSVIVNVFQAGSIALSRGAG